MVSRSLEWLLECNLTGCNVDCQACTPPPLYLCGDAILIGIMADFPSSQLRPTFFRTSIFDGRVIWSYSGMSPDTWQSRPRRLRRAMTTTVNE